MDIDKSFRKRYVGLKVVLEFPVNTSDVDVFPVLSNDELTIHFASNRPGSYGWLDIDIATRSMKDNPWIEPINLGPVINYVDAQDGQSLSQDGLTMYVVLGANWPEQVGSCDVYMTTRSTVFDPWGPPVNLIQTLAWHSSIATTRKYYLAMRTEDIASANNLLNSILTKTQDD